MGEVIDASLLAKARRRTGKRGGAGGGGAGGGGDAPSSSSSADAVPFSEDAIALQFADQQVDQLRHVPGWSQWLHWDGARWRPDDRLSHFAAARRICRDAAREAPEKRRRDLAAAKTVAAVVALARADQRLVTVAGELDQAPWLLATPGGTVDLATGAVRPARQADLLTKCTAVAPAPAGTDCPLWRGFLFEVFGGDGALVAFAQRLAGYALTGVTTEHSLVFAYGTGGNGKGVFLNTLSGLLGDYAKTAPMETFTVSQTDRHPTELAMLRGARLVVSQETERGRGWAESKIKALTGGDPIAARFMRQDYFEFTPQFKLIIAGNHKPSLRGVDEAIRRRFHLLPFAVTVPPERRDPELTERLRAEWPAILRWAVDGCAAWREVGLSPPAAVREATDAYLAEQDRFDVWFGDCCEARRAGWESAAALFASWRTWCEGSGERVGSQRDLGEWLRGRGFEAGKSCGCRGFRGVSIVRGGAQNGPSA